MKLIPISKILRSIDKHRINIHNYDLYYLQYAASVELEHRDLIGNDTDLAFSIALAHIKEFPNYYVELKKMESRLDKQWKDKAKPALFIQ